MSDQPTPEAAAAGNGQPGEAPKEEPGTKEGNDGSPSQETPGEAPIDPDASKTAKDSADEDEDEDASSSDESSDWPVPRDDDDDDEDGMSNYLTMDEIEAMRQRDKRRRVRKWRRARKNQELWALIQTQEEVEASDEGSDGGEEDNPLPEEEEESEEDPDAEADETTEEDLIRAGINFRGGPAAPTTLESRRVDQILARVMKGELDPEDLDESRRLPTPKPPQSGRFTDTPGTGGSAFDLGRYTIKPPKRSLGTRPRYTPTSANIWASPPAGER
ncbi:hypothetical protein PG984_015102 [Apiospora sp. TS-2023a]